jgi:hypothetical protein
MGSVYDEYEYDPWEIHEEEEEPEGQFIFCPDPVSEKPSPKASQPASNDHPPMLTKYIQPCVSNCGAEWDVCYKFCGVFHSFYEPVNKYLK